MACLSGNLVAAALILDYNYLETKSAGEAAVLPGAHEAQVLRIKALLRLYSGSIKVL